LENTVDLLDFLFKWVAIKSEFMLKKGVSFSDFEELRSVGLQFVQDRTEQKS
jgi:hypothetical protein